MEERRLRCFPPEDEAFCAAVAACAKELEFVGVNRRTVAQSLQQAVRFMYPDVLVVAQNELAADWPGREIWYVYRDGRPSHQLNAEPAM
jgi:hypothetical protein